MPTPQPNCIVHPVPEPSPVTRSREHNRSRDPFGSRMCRPVGFSDLDPRYWFGRAIVVGSPPSSPMTVGPPRPGGGGCEGSGAVGLAACALIGGAAGSEYP